MLGDALGAAYVKETFTPAARRRARDMVDHLVAALDARLHTLEWMGDSTRAQAVGKLRAQTFANARDMARIDRPLDKTEWRMTAPTVNASYSASFNDITFPAGILQAPFFDPAADDAVNYGGMGAVIGHEMTHGFDDQGRQF